MNEVQAILLHLIDQALNLSEDSSLLVIFAHSFQKCTYVFLEEGPKSRQHLFLYYV